VRRQSFRGTFCGHIVRLAVGESTTRCETMQGASRGGVGELTGKRQIRNPVRVERKEYTPFRLPLARLTHPPSSPQAHQERTPQVHAHNRLTTAPNHQLQLTRRRTRNRERRTSPMQVHRRAIPSCTRRREVIEPQNGTESAVSSNYYRVVNQTIPHIPPSPGAGNLFSSSLARGRLPRSRPGWQGV
jgi:hypothetical protein